jgi:Transposase DDE domain group 1
LWCQGYPRPPKAITAITLDIDGTSAFRHVQVPWTKRQTADTVHGHQQLSLFNAFHHERCFMPLHVYDEETGHRVVTILRPGETPDGNEVHGHVRRLVRRIRMHWPNTVITVRGDSHYGRPEAMEWCEQNVVQYVFGLAQNTVLEALVQAGIDVVNARWGATGAAVIRDYTETRYAAKSWSHPRRVVARIEATYQGPRYPLRRHQHRSLWRAMALWQPQLRPRPSGQRPDPRREATAKLSSAENLIKRHKSRVGLRPNQLPLAAGQLVTSDRCCELASGEFSTIPGECSHSPVLRLLKIAVRIKETASRVRLAFAANCPGAALFRGPGGHVNPASNVNGGAQAPAGPAPINLSRLPDTVWNAVQPAEGEV